MTTTVILIFMSPATVVIICITTTATEPLLTSRQKQLSVAVAGPPAPAGLITIVMAGSIFSWRVMLNGTSMPALFTVVRVGPVTVLIATPIILRLPPIFFVINAPTVRLKMLVPNQE